VTRPILWAGGILVSAVISGSSFGHRLVALGYTPAPEAPVLPSDNAGGPVLVLQQDLRGQYTAHPEVEGRTLRMLVDTGASLCALSEEDAGRIGLRLSPSDFTKPIATANGTLHAAPVRLREVRVGEIVARDVEAVVVPRGQLGTSLLGMSFLRRLKGFAFASGRLTLRG
jgi:aspartyl protease family protein